jgi:threonine synthase
MNPHDRRGRGVIARYAAWLPVTAATPVVSLGEGSTPLIYSPRLSAAVGRACEVFVKYEGLNPSGSFKDRGMTVAVSKALERGAQTLICASIGNTSASAATYAARAGLRGAVPPNESAVRRALDNGRS